jgi:glycosyltransferase involved in cell wall biosynthesis
MPGLENCGYSCEVNFLLPSNGVLLGFARSATSSIACATLLSSLLALARSYISRVQLLLNAKRFDLIIIQCEVLPLAPAFLESFLLRVPFVYDFDDAFFLRYRSGSFRWLSPLLGSKFDRLMSAAKVVTAGNTSLAAYARRFSANVTVLPSVVDTDHYRPAEIFPGGHSADPFTVGWIGSPSTAPYLQLLVQPLQQLARERSVRLLVVGGPAPAIADVEVVEQPWSLEQEVPLIQQFDVGVMPLPDTSWARGKCAYKLIQCMACGIPVVASRVGANVDAVPPECGFLADLPAEWLDALRVLAADAELRQRLGASGRHWVEQRYSLRSASPVLTGVIQSAAAALPSQ